jgi:hypothetical protein
VGGSGRFQRCRRREIPATIGSYGPSGEESASFHKGERIVADEAVGGFLTAWLNTLVMEEWFTERLAAAQ